MYIIYFHRFKKYKLRHLALDIESVYQGTSRPSLLLIWSKISIYKFIHGQQVSFNFIVEHLISFKEK